MFARKTDAEAGLPPVLVISEFRASRLDLLMARMGLSFERRIGCFLEASESESGGVGGSDIRFLDILPVY